MSNQFDQVFVKSEPDDFLFQESAEPLDSSNKFITFNANHDKHESSTLIHSEIDIKSDPHDDFTSGDLDLSTYCEVEMDYSNNQKVEAASHFLDVRNEFKATNVSKENHTANTSNKPKRIRKVIDLDTKIRIVHAHEEGKKVMEIAKDENLNSSTVSTILKEKERIKEVGKTMMGKNVIMMTKRRDKSVVKMEELLRPWIMENITKRNLLTLKLIQAKAKSIFDEVKEGNEKFSASNGWFYNFQKRYGLNHVKIMGDHGYTIADVASVIPFKTELQQFIKKEGYLPQQVFNVDETSLSWKMLPDGTYLHEQIKTMPEFSLQKDRITLLLGGNMAGYKLKPFLIGEEENPYEILTLPVYYKTNSNHWITSSLFEEWFTNYFVPEVRNYCKNNNLDFKVLLLVDSSPVHPRYSLNLLNEKVKVVFMPENTNSVIQPMEQGAIATFKAHYIKSIFASAIMAMERGTSLIDFWIKYNLLDAIQNINYAWKDVSENCMLGVWKKIMDNDSTPFHITEERIIPDVINLGQRLNFVLKYDYIEGVINEEYRSTSDELLELFVKEKEEARMKKETISSSSSSSPSVGPRIPSIYEEISPHLNKVFSAIRSKDKDKARAEHIINKIEQIVSIYKKVNP